VHFLWNFHYNVIQRVNRFSDIRTNALMQNIVNMSTSASVSLLYPEGQLFPRIFWSVKRGSVIGSIPSFMLHTSGKPIGGLASVVEHLNVRNRDGDKLTSREYGYWHYCFDLLLNSSLNRAPSALVFQRGFEFLAEKSTYSVTGTSSMPANLPMNEHEDTRRVQELSSLLKKGAWHYFLTLTVNDSETPGIRQITTAILNKANGNEQLEEDLTACNLPFALRA